jgi:superfamily II DNA/RNA helicase
METIKLKNGEKLHLTDEAIEELGNWTKEEHYLLKMNLETISDTIVFLSRKIETDEEQDRLLNLMFSLGWIHSTLMSFLTNN